MADKKIEVFAAIIIGCVGVFFVFGMPFFVGGIISELGLSQSQANLVSSAEIAGMALSSILGFFLDPEIQMEDHRIFWDCSHHFGKLDIQYWILRRTILLFACCCSILNWVIWSWCLFFSWSGCNWTHKQSR